MHASPAAVLGGLVECARTCDKGLAKGLLYDAGGEGPESVSPPACMALMVRVITACVYGPDGTRGLYDTQEFELVQAVAEEEGDTTVVDRARRGLALVLTEIGTRVKLCGDTAQCVALYRQALAADPAYAVRTYALHPQPSNLRPSPPYRNPNLFAGPSRSVGQPKNPSRRLACLPAARLEVGCWDCGLHVSEWARGVELDRDSRVFSLNPKSDVVRGAGPHSRRTTTWGCWSLKPTDMQRRWCTTNEPLCCILYTPSRIATWASCSNSRASTCASPSFAHPCPVLSKSQEGWKGLGALERQGRSDHAERRDASTQLMLESPTFKVLRILSPVQLAGH